MINLDEVIAIHAKLIERFGGANGVRDYALLDSSIKRPFQTFNEVDLIQRLSPKQLQ